LNLLAMPNALLCDRSKAFAFEPYRKVLHGICGDFGGSKRLAQKRWARCGLCCFAMAAIVLMKWIETLEAFVYRTKLNDDRTRMDCQAADQGDNFSMPTRIVQACKRSQDERIRGDWVLASPSL
jgi:hypothetical protein